MSMFPNKDKRRLLYRAAGLICFLCLMVGPEDLFPWGFPQVTTRPRRSGDCYKPIDYEEDSLMFHNGRTKVIYGRNSDLVQGPETVVMNPVDGTIHLLTETGFLLSMTDLQQQQQQQQDTTTDDSKKKKNHHHPAVGGVVMNAQVNLVHDVGHGRPLGGAFTRDGKTIYIADAVLGLTRISDVNDPHSKLEVVVSSIINHHHRREDGSNASASSISSRDDVTKVTYVNDVCIGPKSNKVYFTAASDIVPEKIGQGYPDTMFASKMDLIRGIPTGKVLEYDPTTDQVRVLAQNIHFANGIAVDTEEQYLVVAETFGLRIWKYHLNLNDDKAGGEMEVIVDRHNMMGYPDGVDCNPNTGKCYAAIPSPIVPVLKLLMAVPQPIELLLRYLLLMLPRKLAPPIVKFGGVLEFDPITTNMPAVRYMLDPKGQDITKLSGVTVHNNKLYLGSLTNKYIGLYDLAL